MHSSIFLFGEKLSSRIFSSMLSTPSGISTSGINTCCWRIVLLKSKRYLWGIEWTHLERQRHCSQRCNLLMMLKRWMHLQLISLEAFPDYLICLFYFLRTCLFFLQIYLSAFGEQYSRTKLYKPFAVSLTSNRLDTDKVSILF